jgi:hypothetical protein
MLISYIFRYHYSFHLLTELGTNVLVLLSHSYMAAEGFPSPLMFQEPSLSPSLGSNVMLEPSHANVPPVYEQPVIRANCRPVGVMSLLDLTGTWVSVLTVPDAW